MYRCYGASATSTVFAQPFDHCDGGAVGACPIGERWVLGSGCAAVGRPCDAGGDRWPAQPPGRARWVADDAAAEAGDGSRASPWSLSTALSRAMDGDVLVLSSGTHRATELPSMRLTIYGRCANETRVESTGLTVTGTAAIDGLLLIAPIRLRESASLSLLGASLEVTATSTIERHARLRVADAKIAGSRLRIEGRFTAEASELRLGRIEVAGADGRAVLDRTLHWSHTYVSDGGAIEMNEIWAELEADQFEPIFHVRGGAIALRRTRTRGGHDAIEIQSGAQILLDQVWSGPHRLGLVHQTEDGPTVVVAKDVTGRRTGLINIAGGASADLERLAGHGGMWMFYATPARTLVARDLSALQIETAVFANVDSASIARVSARGGLYGLRLGAGAPMNMPARIDVSDLAITGTEGAAVVVRGENGGAHVTIARLTIEDGRGAGITMREGPVRLELGDLLIRGVTAADPASPAQAACRGYTGGCVGNALFLRSGIPVSPALILERFDISGAEVAGIDVLGFAKVTARNGRVRADRIGLASGGAEPWEDRFANVRFASGP